MYDLGKKIDEFSDELYIDLGLADLPEERKADLFARIQEHLHQALLATLRGVLGEKELGEVRTTLDQEDYGRLASILNRYPAHKSEIEKKLETEMQNLKVIISEEQKNERETS